MRRAIRLVAVLSTAGMSVIGINAARAATPAGRVTAADAPQPCAVSYLPQGVDVSNGGPVPSQALVNADGVVVDGTQQFPSVFSENAQLLCANVPGEATISVGTASDGFLCSGSIECRNAQIGDINIAGQPDMPIGDEPGQSCVVVASAGGPGIYCADGNLIDPQEP